jgi:hypothetical protein
MTKGGLNVNTVDRFNEVSEAMNQLDKISVLLRKADAPRYIVDRIEGIECRLIEFCNDIEDLIKEDDFND